MIAQVLAVHPGICFDQGRLGAVSTSFTNEFFSMPNGKSAIDLSSNEIVNANIQPAIRDPLWKFVGYDRKFSISETIQTFFWQFLELMPLPQRYQNPTTKKWHKAWL